MPKSKNVKKEVEEFDKFMNEDPNGEGKDVEGEVAPLKVKVTKVMSFPSRKINMGNYDSAEISAGMEVVFDEPVPIDSREVKDAYTKMREVIRDEFKEQYKPLKPIIEKNKKMGRY